MADFEKAFIFTMTNEGGYSHDAADRGGETYMGIARVFYPQWIGWKTIDSLKTTPNFPGCLQQNSSLQDEVKSFYKTEYWDKLLLDQANSQNIAVELFDLGVNTGLGTAVKMLQRSLNVLNKNQILYPDITVDGIMGQGTMSALNSCTNSKALLKCIVALQGEKYISICEANHSQEVFMLGWITRAFEQFTLSS